MEIDISNPFDEFIALLNQLGLQRIAANEKTNAAKFPNETAIDHFFIPQSWYIVNAGLMNDTSLYSITDHKGVYADIKIR